MLTLFPDSRRRERGKVKFSSFAVVVVVAAGDWECSTHKIGRRPCSGPAGKKSAVFLRKTSPFRWKLSRKVAPRSGAVVARVKCAKNGRFSGEKCVFLARQTLNLLFFFFSSTADIHSGGRVRACVWVRERGRETERERKQQKVHRETGEEHFLKWG